MTRERKSIKITTVQKTLQDELDRLSKDIPGKYVEGEDSYTTKLRNMRSEIFWIAMKLDVTLHD